MKFVQSVLNLLLVASCSAFVAPHAKRAGLFGVATAGRVSESCRWSAVADAPTAAADVGEGTEQKIRNVAVIGKFLNDL